MDWNQYVLESEWEDENGKWERKWIEWPYQGGLSTKGLLRAWTFIEYNDLFMVFRQSSDMGKFEFYLVNLNKVKSMWLWLYLDCEKYDLEVRKTRDIQRYLIMIIS